MCNIFTPCFEFSEQIKKEISSLQKTRLLTARKYTLRDEFSWETFFVDFYAFTRPPNERKNYSSSQVYQKAIELEKLGKQILVFEVSVEDPEMLSYTESFGPCVPKTLDEYKVSLRKRMKNVTSRHNVMHVFDTDLYNGDIKRFLQEHCFFEEV